MNQSLKIYWTSVEFTLKQTHTDFKKVKGGFVYAFVKAVDQSEALIKFKTELDNIQLIPTEFEFVNHYKDVEWTNEKQEKHFQMIIEEANRGLDVVLDDFYMFESTQ